MPFWLGTAIRSFTPEGIQFERYERIGYTEFALHDVRVDRDGLAVDVDRVQTLYPWTWLGRVWRERAETPFLSVGNATIEILAVDTPKGEGSEMEIVYKELFDLVEKTIGSLDKWAGYVVAERVLVKKGSQSGEIRNLVWRDRNLSFAIDSDLYPKMESKVVVDARNFPFRFTLNNGSRGLSVELVIEQVDGKANVVGKIGYLNNELIFEAHTPEHGLSIEYARWRANDWHIRKSDLGIEQSAYDELEFGIAGEWDGGSYRNEIVGRVLASELSEQWPAIRFETKTMGDMDRIQLDALTLSGPGVDVKLDDDIRYDFVSGKILGDVQFAVDLDLSHLNYEGLSGFVKGNASLTGTEKGQPSGRFELVTSDLKWKNYELERTELFGSIDWPMLKLEKSTVYWDSDVKAVFSGEYDFSNSTIIDGRIEANLASGVLKEFVPEGIVFDSVESRIQVLGPIAKPIHKGEVVFRQFSNELLKPLDGEILWYGESAEFAAIRASAKGEDRKIDLEASASVGEGGVKLELNRFGLNTDKGGSLSIKEPTEVTFKSKVENETRSFDLKLDGLALSTEEGTSIKASLDTLYPNRLNANLDVKDTRIASWVSPWLKDDSGILDIVVHDAEMELIWDDGPAILNADFDAVLNAEDLTYRFSGDVKSTAEETKINSLQLSVGDEELARLVGNAPPLFDPRRLQPLKVDPLSTFQLEIATQNSPLLAKILSGALPFEVERFNANINLGGPLSKPKGTLVVQVDVPREKVEHGLPAASINIDANVDGETLNLNQLTLNSGDKVFEGNGVAELPENAIRDLLVGNSVVWNDTRLELVLPKSNLAPISRFVPQFLGPGGTIKAELKGNSLDRLLGRIDIDGVNTRSIFPFGALREISSKLTFCDDVLRLESFVGRIGRESIEMEGFFNLEQKSFELSVKASNAPLLRQAGMLIRSDLDLKISQGPGEIAAVTGLVNLRESFFLIDTTSLAVGGGGGGRSPESRPPYFSVDVDPLGDWTFDLEIKGERFMKLQTPAATGRLSVDMEMRGTLAEPWLRGRVSFDEGDLLFPFAAFEVQQGDIDFPIGDPYTPVIAMVGETQRFGYDLSVNISGSVFDPQIRFASSPPLTSEQILMMIMAGENPEGLGEYSASKRASKIGSYLSKGLFSSGGDSSGLGSRLSIESGQNLSRQGKETMEIEFRIENWLQLVGEYDEYDAWNAGLRLRLLKQRIQHRDGSEAKK